MVLSSISCSAAAERVTVLRANCGASFSPEERLGREIGIVEGWGGDEDEDVSIDSDEKDSRSERLLAATENLQLECVPTEVSNLHLFNCSSMLEKTESSADAARYEDPESSKERAVELNKMACPNVDLEGDGSGVLNEKEQVGSFHGELVENVKKVTVPKGIRVGSSWGGSAVEGGTKRLDARRFRRDFNVKADSISARSKVPVREAGRMRGTFKRDAEEEKKLPKEKDSAAGKGKNESATKSHMRPGVKKGAGNVAGDYSGTGNRSSREEISKQAVSVLQRNLKARMVSGAEQFKRDSSKKRRFNDLVFAQACERKSSLRVKVDLLKHSEGRVRRETRGHGDAGSIAKSKRARKDEVVSPVGTSVPEKQTPPKRGLQKVGKSPDLLLTKAGRQKSALDNRHQSLFHGADSGKEENSVRFVPGDGARKFDSGVAMEIFELDSLEKVFERRLTKRKDIEKAAGENPEPKRLMGRSTIAQLSDGSGSMVRTPFGRRTGEKAFGKPADRRPTTSTDRAQGADKAQQSGGGSDESQNGISEQWQEGERGGLNLGRRPTRSLDKVNEGADRGYMLPGTKGATAKGAITISEDTNNDLINFGVDMHLFPPGSSGSALTMAGAAEIAVDYGAKISGKRTQSRAVEMENNGRISPSRSIGQGADLEVKEGTEGEIAVIDELAKAKKQRLTRKCIAMSVPAADVDPNIVEAFSKQALLREIHRGNDKGLEEGEIRSSDFDWKQESKFTEPVLLREAGGETRLGENDLTQEDSKSVTIPFVYLNEPSLSEIHRRPGKSQLVPEESENKERAPGLEGGCDWKQRAVGTLDIGHVGPDTSALAGDAKSDSFAVAGGYKPQKVKACSESPEHEKNCTDRWSVQAEYQIDKLSVPEKCSTRSCESRGRDQDGELKSHSSHALKRVQTSELQAVYDLTGEDRSDSDDGRLSDHHNSYCEYCRQGGELLCCDGSGCKITYHLECTEPKLWEVPSGNWYCPMCAHKRLSYGVHAVSKSVESIWDVRNCAQSSGHPSLSPKDKQKIYQYGVNDKDLGTTGRSLEVAREMRVKNRDRVEDECIAAVTVFVDDEEGIHESPEGTSGRQGTSKRTDEDCNEQKLTERRQGDGDVKMSEKARMTEANSILGSSSSVMHGLKLVNESGDKEYFVKWRGISHAHNTWVSESELAKLSPKGLARFKKKVTEGQVVQWNSDWAEPQRLVDKRISIPPRRPGGGRGRGFLGMDTQQEWFVKWKGLGYEHCTWEPAHSGVLLDVKVKQLEVMYESWSEAARQRSHPRRVVEADKLREASFKQLQSQPEWIRFRKLLPYQFDRLNQLRQRWHYRQNTIIVDQDGQEKLSTTVTFLLSLIEEYGVYRLILVVVPVFEIQCWEAEITEYSPQVSTVVYMGSKEARGVIQRFELNRRNTPLKVQVVLTTCDIAFSDFDYLRKHNWEVVVVDESQQSKTAKSHRAFLQFDSTFWLLFVSELSKYNVEELQQMVLLVRPESSSSTSNVRNQFTELDESGQLQYLKDQLDEHMVRDSRREDASGLKLVECWVGTNMTSLQIQLYCNTLTKHYSLLLSGRLRSDPDSPSLHDFVTQLRLCCQHPYLVDPTLQGCGKEDLPPSQSLIDAGVEASEKWQFIHAMLSVLQTQHHRVVILSQSLMQLFFLDDYLRQKYGADSYELVDTRYSALRKNSAVQRFNAKDSTRSFFLLRTGASGFSLRLKDKDIVLIHDSDLNPANDLEYLRKVLHRVDGELQVFRLYQRFTVEEGSMVYDRQKKLGPDPKPLSVKILQQLLRWKVQHILELDSSSERIDMPKGKQKFDLNDKVTRDLKRVRNFLQGDIEMEAATEIRVNELWSELDGDSVREFWFPLLKDRHVELQDREEQSNSGKGLRQRKRVQYSEEALALAPYSVLEEEELRRKRRRPQQVESASISVTQDKGIHSSLQSSPSTPRQADSRQDVEAVQENLSSRSMPGVRRAVTSEFAVGFTVPVMDRIADEQSLKPVGSDGVCEQHNQEAEQKSLSKPIISSVGKKVKKEELLRHATIDVVQMSKYPKPAGAGSVSATTSHVDRGKRLRMEQKQQLLKMEPELSRIVGILQVAESIAGYSQQLLSHVMNNFRMPKEPRELVVMVEISLCLIACTHFRHVVEHLPAVSRVGEKMNLALKNEEFASVYSRLEGMCKTYVAIPTAQQGADDEEIFFDEAAHGSTLLQPISTGTESPVHIPPDSQVSEPSLKKRNLRPSSGQKASIDRNNLSQICRVPVSKAEIAHSEQDALPVTELEPSDQPPEAEDCEVTGCQNADPALQAHSHQETVANNSQVNSGLKHARRQSMAISSEKVEPLLSQTGAIRARLKLDRDQLLHSWLAKQKLEVQEFNASCTQARDACQKSFEKQKAEILATSVNMEQREELLREIGDVSASTVKLLEREEEDRRQVMNSTQRDLRDRINSLYTKLLPLVTNGMLPDLVSEARSMGLTFALQSQTPKFLDHGPTHSKQSHETGVTRVQQSAPISLVGQNTDLGSLPSTLSAEVQAHCQHETQLQSREGTPSPPPYSQIELTQSRSQYHAHVPPQMQLHCLPPAEIQSSLVTAFSQPLSQAMSSNLDQEVSPPEELVAAPLQQSHPRPQRSQLLSLQQNGQTKEGSQTSHSHPDLVESPYSIVGSEPPLAISTQELERTYSVVERGILQPQQLTDLGRVSEMLCSSPVQQSIVSQAAQTPTNLQARRSQILHISTNLQPRVTQILHAPTSLQARVSRSVQASPSLQPRVPQTVDNLASLQPRVSQIRRPLSNQQTTRQPHHRTAVPQVRVQTQLQPTGGPGYSISSASVGGTLLATQARSNVHSQNVPLGAHSSQRGFGLDPLVHEENRLKRDQEKVRLIYNEETALIKTQYDREAAELRRKYEVLLYERARTFEQKNAALKDNLDKVDRNRQLAEALKLRSLLDQQKARQTPGQSMEAMSGTGQPGRLSVRADHISGRGHLHLPHQTTSVRNGGRSTGRGFAGAVANVGSGTVTGTSNSTSQVITDTSHLASWESSGQSNIRHAPPPGISPGGPVCSALPICVPRPLESFSSRGCMSVPEGLPQTTPSLSSCSSPFSVGFERVLFQPQSGTALYIQQERPWVSPQEGSEIAMVPASSARLENLSQNSSSELVPVLSSTAPATSITTPVRSPIATEAVVVSVSPALSPVSEQVMNMDFVGNVFVQDGHSNFGSGPLSADEISDLLMPFPREIQVGSILETRVRSVTLVEAELEALGAPSHGHKGLASSQTSTVRLSHNPQTPPVPMIFLSDDDE